MQKCLQTAIWIPAPTVHAPPSDRNAAVSTDATSAFRCMIARVARRPRCSGRLASLHAQSWTRCCTRRCTTSVLRKGMRSGQQRKLEGGIANLWYFAGRFVRTVHFGFLERRVDPLQLHRLQTPRFQRRAAPPPKIEVEFEFLEGPIGPRTSLPGSGLLVLHTSHADPWAVYQQ